MYDTGLTDAISSNIQNEVQSIIVSSTIVNESYVIDYLYFRDGLCFLLNKNP